MDRKNTITLAVAVIIALYGAFVLFSGPSLAPLNEGMMPITPMTATTTLTTPTTTMKKTTTATTTTATKSAPTVSYTDRGFTPAMIEITSGGTVRFVNNSSKEMSIASVGVGGFGAATPLNQEGSVKRGGTFTAIFAGPGSWSYMNRLWQRDGGNIIVK